jgi:hypothetical protein
MALFDRAATAKDMGSILVLDATGTVVLDSRTMNPEAVNYRDRDYFRVHYYLHDVGLYVSPPWYDDHGDPFIALSRRLNDDAGHFTGVVVGMLHVSYFERLFKHIDLGERAALTLTRHDGSLLMRQPMQNMSIGTSLSPTPVFARIAADKSGFFENWKSAIDGVHRLYIFQSVGDYPLHLSYGQSVDIIFAEWSRKAWRIGSMIAALCIVNLGAIAFLATALRRRRDAEWKLAISATTDSLTGLCNRRRLDELSALEWRRAQRTGNRLRC